MSKDGIIDEEALTENKKIRDNAKKIIKKECDLFQILSYRSTDLTRDTIEQNDTVEKCVKIFQSEKMVTFEDLDKTCSDLDKKQ